MSLALNLILVLIIRLTVSIGKSQAIIASLIRFISIIRRSIESAVYELTAISVVYRRMPDYAILRRIFRGLASEEEAEYDHVLN